MGAADIKEFRAVVAKVQTTFFEHWEPAVYAARHLAMFDMLPAVGGLTNSERAMLLRNAEAMSPTKCGKIDFDRIAFAIYAVERREIYDLGIPLIQVNDGRVFLGCTILKNEDVQNTIDTAIANAKAKIQRGQIRQKDADDTCCGALFVGWFDVTEQRRAHDGDSLISHLAAAQHYLRARMHVCRAEASVSQMRNLIDGYDAKKRFDFMRGKTNAAAINKGNPVFPPDFAVRQWAYKGVDDGEVDRSRCNAGKSPPIIIPDIDFDTES